MIQVLKAEVLKYHHTSALLLAIGVPFIITLMSFFVQMFAGKAGSMPPEILRELMLGTSVGLWVGMALPMGIGILASQVVSLEDGHLKQILIQPIARWQIFLGKVLIVMGLIAISQLVLIGSLSLAMVLASFFKASAVLELIKGLGLMTIGALPIIILGITLAFHFKWPITIGSALLGASFGAYFLKHPYAWKFFPWSLPMAIYGKPDPTIFVIILAFILGFTALGLWSFSKYEPR